MKRAGVLFAVVLLAAGTILARESYQARPGLIPVKGFVLYYNAQGPLSTLPMTRSELPKDAVPAGKVFGKSCQHGLAIPLSASLRATSVSGAIGDGGFRKALENIHDENPDLIGVYDVKVDHHTITVLGFYRRLCIEVTARGLIRREEPIPPARRYEKIPPYLLER